MSGDHDRLGGQLSNGRVNAGAVATQRHATTGQRDAGVRLAAEPAHRGVDRRHRPLAWRRTGGRQGPDPRPALRVVVKPLLITQAGGRGAITVVVGATGVPSLPAGSGVPWLPAGSGVPGVPAGSGAPSVPVAAAGLPATAGVPGVVAVGAAVVWPRHPRMRCRSCVAAAEAAPRRARPRRRRCRRRCPGCRP